MARIIWLAYDEGYFLLCRSLPTIKLNIILRCMLNKCKFLMLCLKFNCFVFLEFFEQCIELNFSHWFFRLFLVTLWLVVKIIIIMLTGFHCWILHLVGLVLLLWSITHSFYFSWYCSFWITWEKKICRSLYS